MLGSTRCFGSPSKDTMATSLEPGVHDLEVLLGDRQMRPLQQQRLFRRDLGAHDLDDLRGEVAPGVEGREAARLQKPHEAAVAG